MSYDLGTAHGEVEITYSGQAEVARAKDDIEDLKDRADRADDPLRKLVSTLGKIGGTLAKGAGIAILATSLTNAAAAAGSAGVQILGMVPALASVLSLSAAIPGAIVAIQAALGVVKLALSGVGEAMKEAFNTESAEKFEEALKKLSPAAQEFARTFKSDLVPGLRAFQQGVQEAFFRTNLQDLFPRIANAMKELGPFAQSLADHFGRAAKEIAGFALSGESIRFVQDSVITLQQSLLNLMPGIEPVLRGLRDVGTVGLPVLERLSLATGEAAQRFGAWMSEISASGQLAEWIEEALSTLATLGGTIRNVGSILGAVFGAAEATGGGLLNTLNELTGQAAAFLNSVEGQEVLQGVFGALLEVARQLAPVFGTLASSLASALSPVLRQLATQIGPVLLQVVEALTPAFGPLAGAIGSLLKALVPLLPPIAQFTSMMAQLLGHGVSALAAEFGPVAAILGGALLEALQALQPVLSTLVANALPQAAILGAKLAQAFAPLAPVIVETAQAFAEAIVPVLPQIVSLMARLTPIIVKLANGFVILLTIGLRVAAWLAQFGAAAIGMVGTVVGAFTRLRSMIASAFTAAYNTVVSVGARIIGFFASLPGRLVAGIAALPGLLVRVVQNAVHRMAFAFGAGIGALVTMVVKAPGRIRNAFNAVVALLRTVASNAWTAVRNAFTSGVNAVVNFVRNAPGRIRSGLNALPGLLRGAANSAMSSFRNAISSGINSAVSLARGIAGRIRSAVGNLGSALVSAGRDAVMGLVRGLRGAIGAAVSAAASVGRSVISGIKSTLKIGSPSKITMELGGDTGEGYVLGLLDKIKAVKSAAQELANTIIQPTVGLRTNATMAQRAAGGAINQAAAGGGFTVHQTVNALPGMSARAVSNYSASKLSLLARSGVIAVAVAPPRSQEA